MTDPIVINQGFTTRTRKSGKQYTTIDVRSEPLVHDLDPRTLGAGPAAAIAEHLRNRIAGITARASDATLRARANYAKSNTLHASQRYSGGRIGATTPAQSDRLFNDSGRLVKSIVARAAEGGQWIVNVAANRLDESTFGRGFAAMLDRLASFVPEIRDPRQLMDSIPVRRAIQQGMADMIKKGEARVDELREARARAIVGLGRQLFGLVG